MSWVIDYFKYAWVDFKLQCQVRKLYYHDHAFSKLDRALLSSYLFLNPYRVSKLYQKRKREKDIHVYGETPLTALEEIGKQVGLLPDDHLLELGSGRGRAAFFFHHFFKCQVTGIERIPHFVKLANHVGKKHHVKDVSFVCRDMLSIDHFKDVSVIYLYGTCLKDKEIEGLIERFQTCKPGTRIVTVSFPLQDYNGSERFQLKKSFTLSFPWGETEAYLQTVR